MNADQAPATPFLSAAFAPTRWSLVLAARGEAPAARAALKAAESPFRAPIRESQQP